MQIHRSITTTDTLPFFGMRRAVRTLFSPAERRRPWLLYLTPGLLLAIALEQAWAIVLTPLFTKLVNRYARDVFLFFGMTTRTLARHSLVLLTATICGPLEVIKVGGDGQGEFYYSHPCRFQLETESFLSGQEVSTLHVTCPANWL